LTKVCIATLEKKASAAPSLVEYGYVKSIGDNYKKFGPKVPIASGSSLSRSSINLNYSPGRLNSSTNTCAIAARGLERNLPTNSCTEKEKTVFSASYKAAESLGYKKAANQTKRRKFSEELTNGSTTIIMSSWSKYEYSARSLSINFYGDRR
tara:strand:+ start:37 stop:492 length:456 start_codon:yes stop_codon:yes gene_type:complete